MNRLLILKRIFQFLNDNFNYAVIHHHDDILNNKKDIDIVIDTTKYLLYKAFIDFAKKNNFYIPNMYTIDINVYRIDLVECSYNNYNLLQLDFFMDFESKNLMPINSKILLLNKKETLFENFSLFILNETVELNYYIMKKAYKKEKIEEDIKYFNKLNHYDFNKIENIYISKIKYFNSIKYKLIYIKNRIAMLLTRIVEKNGFRIVIKVDSIETKESFVSYLEESLIFRYIYVKGDTLNFNKRIRKLFQPYVEINFILTNKNNNSNYESLIIILKKRNLIGTKK